MTTRSITTEDGLRLHATVRGRDDAPVSVLLSHCWTADEDDWHYQVHDLMERYGHGVKVITWDHRGHGRSEMAEEHCCTISYLARDMGRLVDELAPTGRLVVAGHSIGGMTIAALPEERPDLIARIDGVLLVSTSSGELDKVTLGLPEPGALLKAQIPRILNARARLLSRSKRQKAPFIERRIVKRFLWGEPVRARDIGVVVDQIINCPPATMSGFYHDLMVHDRAEGLRAFDDIPTTVMVGSRDQLTPPAHAAKLARSIRGARLLTAPRAGHYLPFERHELVSAELCALVDGALRGAAARPGATHPDVAARQAHSSNRQDWSVESTELAR